MPQKFFQRLELLAFATFLLCAAARSASSQDLFDFSAWRPHLTNALAALDMTERDLAFEKDVGKPDWCLHRNRALLHDPLRLFDVTRDVWKVSTGAMSDITSWLFTALELAPSPCDGKELAAPAANVALPELDPILRSHLHAFLKGIAQASQKYERAVRAVTREDREWAIALLLSDFLRLEDLPERYPWVQAMGVSSDLILRANAEQSDLDPKREAMSLLRAATNVSWSLMLEAASTIWRAGYELAVNLREAQIVWPDSIVRISTDWGPVYIGSPQADVYTEPAVLVLDPGDDDTYWGPAGVANGLLGLPIAVVIDFNGRDRYVGAQGPGPGAAIWGLVLLLDLEGDDFYDSDCVGSAAALFGCSWLEDCKGNDVYRTRFLGQAAAWCGAAVLVEREGADSYHVGLAGQAYAGPVAAALLLDQRGNDTYFAGGLEPDHERNDDRFLSLAQGFAIGLRPFAGGGVAALVDVDGNDEYVADVYGQGVSYWYSLGILVDGGGNDRYTVHQYGQGTGVHLSSALLADLTGNDRYTGSILVQGSAHDYAVGFLYEGAGDDVYVGHQHAQGRALNNGLAMLVDRRGNDAFFATRCDECQGIGNDGDKREYGCLSLLLDLAGQDLYSCGFPNDAGTPRPSFGIVYDAQEGESP